MRPIIIAAAIATLPAVSCGGGPDSATTAGARLALDEDSGDGFADVPVRTHCSVVTEPGDNGPSAMRIFRHASPAGALTLSIQKLPMTCARVVNLKSSWIDAPRSLTLDVGGETYLRCLCSFDFEPFSLAVPSTVQAELDDYALVVKRGDFDADDPLRTTRIGDLIRL